MSHFVHNRQRGGRKDQAEEAVCPEMRVWPSHGIPTWEGCGSGCLETVAGLCVLPGTEVIGDGSLLLLIMHFHVRSTERENQPTCFWKFPFCSHLPGLHSRSNEILVSGMQDQVWVWMSVSRDLRLTSIFWVTLQSTWGLELYPPKVQLEAGRGNEQGFN